MPISPYLDGRPFDPELKRVLGIAFELVCVTLGRIGDSDEHVRRSIVLKVIELAGEYVGRWWVNDVALSFNDRLQLHRSVDDTGHLGATFFGDRNDFEDRVALLLTLLGLVPLKYGKIAHLKDAPDIVAISAERHIYVIDCTTGDINSKGKLQRLYERAKAIREALSQSAQPSSAVLPVIFTTFTRQETMHLWPTASALGISIVSRENITNLLNQVDAPPNPQQLYQGALRCIPQVQAEPASNQ